MIRLTFAGLSKACVIVVFSGLMSANAKDQPIENRGIFSIEVGALVVLGADFQIYYRREGEPLLFGFRYLETEDDFVNEAYLGLPGDDSDKEFITRSGPFIRYLFSPEANESYYLSAALFKTTEKIECGAVSNEDSATSPYFGGGYMGWADQTVSYNIGFMLAPSANLEVDAGGCESESDGGFDLSLGLALNF